MSRLLCTIEYSPLVLFKDSNVLEIDVASCILRLNVLVRFYIKKRSVYSANGIPPYRNAM